MPVATAVTQGTDLDVGDIPGGLARLAHRSLLMSSRATQGGRPSVFRQLDTVRAHARHHLSEVGETAVSLERRDSWVRQLLAARPRARRSERSGLVRGYRRHVLHRSSHLADCRSSRSRLSAAAPGLGDGGAGAFLEALANFVVLTGDAETSIPLYAASHVDARRSGTYWPIQLQSDTLLDRMRQQTAPEHFGELWTDGERLTFRDVARSRGLT